MAWRTMSTRSFSERSSSDAPAPKQDPWMYKPFEGMDCIEPFQHYRAGGYYPVRIGDQLCSSRYHIVHKLGHGSYSTIWLARDEHLARYVAIKIAVSRPESTESAILTKMWAEEGCTIKSSAGVALIPDVLDEFEVEGPDIQGVRGKHHCLVTTPARMSISEAREASSKCIFQPMVARAIAAQLIQAVASLHSQGIVHADLHDNNILFCLPDTIDDLTPDELYQKYGQPELVEVERMDELPLDPWVPSHGILPIWFGTESDKISLTESRVFLNDFGESFQPAIDSRVYSHTPLKFQPPEILLNLGLQVSFPADVWSLACVLFAVMGGGSPFSSWFATEDEILRQHVDALGRFPDEWWVIWATRDKYYDDQGRSVDGETPWTLEVRLEKCVQEPRRKFGIAEMEDEEKRDFLKLVSKMFKYQPEDRFTAQQALESQWMQNWGLPALKSMEDILQPCGACPLSLNKVKLCSIRC